MTLRTIKRQAVAWAKKQFPLMMERHKDVMGDYPVLSRRQRKQWVEETAANYLRAELLKRK